MLFLAGIFIEALISAYSLDPFPLLLSKKFYSDLKIPGSQSLISTFMKPYPMNQNPSVQWVFVSLLLPLTMYTMIKCLT